MRRAIVLAATHGLALLAGFAGGVYLLPILIAPAGPTAAELSGLAQKAQYSAQFRRDLAGSDALHWGEGEVSISAHAVSLRGRIAPGPDYKLYLSPEFVETEAQFQRVKPRARRIGDVKTFENFVVPVPAGVNPADHTTVVVWCETFGEFITAAKYR